MCSLHHVQPLYTATSGLWLSLVWFLCSDFVLYLLSTLHLTSHFTPFDSLQWPFVRVLGIQEPASVVFSLLNAVTVAVGYWHFSAHSPPNNPLHRPLVAQFAVG